MQLRSLQVRIEERFLSFPDAVKIANEATTDQTDRLIIAIEGAPGTGKSIFATMLLQVLRNKGINTALIEGDMECQPRADRKNKGDLPNWFGDEAIEEVLRYPGSNFTYTGYNPIGSTYDKPYEVWSPERGIILVEGIRSIHRVLTHSNGPVVTIDLQVPFELREIRRAERNIRDGKWTEGEVEERTKKQRQSTKDHCYDTARFLDKSTIGIQNDLRIYR